MNTVIDLSAITLALSSLFLVNIFLLFRCFMKVIKNPFIKTDIKLILMGILMFTPIVGPALFLGFYKEPQMQTRKVRS